MVVILFILLVIDVGSTKSSVYTFQSSENSTVEVGQGNLKLTFSTQGKVSKYINRRNLVRNALCNYCL